MGIIFHYGGKNFSPRWEIFFTAVGNRTSYYQMTRSPYMKGLTSTLGKARRPYAKRLASTLGKARSPYMKRLASTLGKEKSPDMKGLTSTLGKGRSPLYKRLVAAQGKKNPFPLEARGKGLAGRLALRQRRTARRWRRRTGGREAAWLLSEATLVLRGREAVHFGEVTREVARVIEAHLIGNLADAPLALAQELLGMAQAYVAN